MRLIDTVERLRAGLDYHMARHNVLTANLAHIDTPDFKPLDLMRGRSGGSFPSALHVALTNTNPNHLGNVSRLDGAEEGSDGRNWKVDEAPNQAESADGNGVNIDREAVKIATNHVRYDVLAQLASSELASLAWAANDGRNG